MTEVAVGRTKTLIKRTLIIVQCCRSITHLASCIIQNQPSTTNSITLWLRYHTLFYPVSTFDWHYNQIIMPSRLPLAAITCHHLQTCPQPKLVHCLRPNRRTMLLRLLQCVGDFDLFGDHDNAHLSRSKSNASTAAIVHPVDLRSPWQQIARTAQNWRCSHSLISQFVECEKLVNNFFWPSGYPFLYSVEQMSFS